MKITITPETEEDVREVRNRAAMGLPSTDCNEMYRAITVSCQEWAEKHPDLQSLRPGSVVSVPSGLLFVVQSADAWLRLPIAGIEQRLIDPRPVEWSGTEILWSAS